MSATAISRGGSVPIRPAFSGTLSSTASALGKSDQYQATFSNSSPRAASSADISHLIENQGKRRACGTTGETLLPSSSCTNSAIVALLFDRCQGASDLESPRHRNSGSGPHHSPLRPFLTTNHRLALGLSCGGRFPRCGVRGYLILFSPLGIMARSPVGNTKNRLPSRWAPSS